MCFLQAPLALSPKALKPSAHQDKPAEGSGAVQQAGSALLDPALVPGAKREPTRHKDATCRDPGVGDALLLQVGCLSSCSVCFLEAP